MQHLVSPKSMKGKMGENRQNKNKQATSQNFDEHKK